MFFLDNTVRIRNKYLQIILTLLMVIILGSCGGGNGGDGGNGGGNGGNGGGGDGTGGSKKLNLSFNGSSYYESSASNRFSKAIAFESDISVNSEPFKSTKSAAINIEDSLLKPHLQSSQRGNIVGRFTPIQFILDIDIIALSNKSLAPLLPASGTVAGSGQPSIRNYLDAGDPIDKLLRYCSSDAGIVPNHYNIVHADKIIRNASVSESSYNTLWIEFLPDAGSSSNDNYYVNSIVVIDLGEKYKGITLPDEIASLSMVQKKDTEHIFSFNRLQPLNFFYGSLVFSADVEKTYIYNPGGILIPASKIDLTTYENPTVNLSWDISDLVELYDNNTADLTDDRVTFRLDNPFPVSLKVVEQPPRGESLFVTLSDTTTDSRKILDVAKTRIKAVIIDDDSLTGKGTVRFASNRVNANEADGSVSLQVIREAGKTDEISVQYSISNQNNSASVGVDFNDVSGDLTWVDGDMAPKYITVPITDDASSETTEFFDVQLTGGTATLSGWDKTRVNIYDNDTTTDAYTGLLFSQNFFYDVESDSAISVKLVRTGDPGGDVSVDVNADDGLATKGVDFSADMKTLVWSDGDMASKTYQVTIINDTTPEPFRENKNDSTAPSEVYMLAARGNKYKTVLQWVNPPDEDFKSTRIIRKQGSAPTSGSDGELIYNGYRPSFYDSTGTSGVHYYYLVQTIDTSGNVSTGVVVDKTQN